MSADRSGLTLGPVMNTTAAGVPNAFSIDQAAGTEMNVALAIPTSGRLHSVYLSFLVVATQFDTLPPIFAVHINDVEVATFTFASGLAAGTKLFVPLTRAANQSLRITPGDVVKFEIKQQPTDSSGVTGSISARLAAILNPS